MAPSTLGVDTLRYHDGFTGATGWDEIDEEGASSAVVDGALVFRLMDGDRTWWTWRSFADAWPVMRTEAVLDLRNGTGSAGPACGSMDPEPRLLAGVVTTWGEGIILRVVDGVTSAVAGGPVDLPPGGTMPTRARVAIECAVASQGVDRVVLWVDGHAVADATTDTIGPFGRTGVYVGVGDPPLEARFHEITTATGDAYAPADTMGSTLGPDPIAFGAPTSALTTLGASSPRFRDPFEDTSIWWTGTDGTGAAAYEGGALALSLAAPGSWRYGALALEVATRVLGVAVDVELDPGSGGAGPMCGSAGTDAASFYYAGGTSENELIVGVIDDGIDEMLARLPLPDGSDVRGRPVRMRLECGASQGGPDRIALWLDDELVMDATTGRSIGPFGRVGLYAKAGDAGWTARFDDLEMATGEVLAPR